MWAKLHTPSWLPYPRIDALGRHYQFLIHHSSFLILISGGVMMITWKQSDAGTSFFLGGHFVGEAIAMPGAADRFIPVQDGVICWERTVPEATDTMEMRLRRPGQARYTMIPAVQYDGNRCMIKDYFDVREESPLIDEKQEPHPPTYFVGGRGADGRPHVIPYRHASIPGATYSEDGATGLGMFLPLSHMAGSCSLYEENGDTIHALLWPEQSTRTVMHAGQWVENLRIPGEKRTTFRAMLVFAVSERPCTAWHKLLDAAWAQNYTRWTPDHTQAELWDLGVSYAKLLYTEEPDGFCGFSIGFTWNGHAWVKRNTQKYEIGWCGQNASLAVSLLTHALKTGDEEAKTMALNVLDAWVRAANPTTGIIPTHYDDNQYTNGFAKTIDACNLGAAAVQLFQAAELAQKLGAPRPQYTGAAISICDFALRVMKDNGQIGKSWLEKDLTPAVKDGSTGAFLTWALAECAARTRSDFYLAAAETSMRFYAMELQQKGYTTAGALDIFTIDKESCIPLLKASLVLHCLTNKDEYLQMATDAAYYLSTWQWHYDRPVLPGSLFDQIGFRLFGGTAVSIHGGMDPYGVFYVNDLLELARLTGNPMWSERAAAIWRHGQQYISDGTYVLDGKAPRPRGSQDESNGTAFGGHEDAPSQWLVAWPTAFRLETLRAWQTLSVEEYTRVI